MKFITLFVSITLLLFSLSCNNSPEEELEKTHLYIATGGNNSIYYTLGQEVTQLINNSSEKLKVIPEITAGPEANLRILSSQSFQLALTTSEQTYFATKGLEKVENVENFLVLGTLKRQPILIVSNNNTIKKINDIKNISLGRGNSRTHVLAQLIFAELGLDLEKLTTRYLSEQEALDVLREEKIESAFILDPFLENKLDIKDLYLIPFSLEEQEQIRNTYSFFSNQTIPAQTFNNQEDEITVLAVDIDLVVSSKLEKDILNELKRIMQKINIK